jgi:hypothetical protein
MRVCDFAAKVAITMPISNSKCLNPMFFMFINFFDCKQNAPIMIKSGYFMNLGFCKMKLGFELMKFYLLIVVAFFDVLNTLSALHKLICVFNVPF